MASLGHIAIGLAAARAADPAPQRMTIAAAVGWSALSFLPDADVVGFGFGIAYGDQWGHRGASHSFVFALLVGTAIGALAALFRKPPLRTGMFATLVLASHPLLDIFTNGGLGCALFWPFDLTRYFAPWTPIPVSPIGLGYLSPYGLFVAAAELTIFAPIFWAALRRPRWAYRDRRSRRGVAALMVAGWIAALWLLFSTDRVRDQIVRIVVRDTTEFTPGFSEAALRGIAPGTPETAVRSRLGAPLSELETPRGPCWLYSRSPNGGYFRARAVCFEKGRAVGVIRRWVRQ